MNDIVLGKFILMTALFGGRNFITMLWETIMPFQAHRHTTNNFIYQKANEHSWSCFAWRRCHYLVSALSPNWPFSNASAYCELFLWFICGKYGANCVGFLCKLCECLNKRRIQTCMFHKCTINVLPKDTLINGISTFLTFIYCQSLSSRSIAAHSFFNVTSGILSKYIYIPTEHMKLNFKYFAN